MTDSEPTTLDDFAAPSDRDPPRPLERRLDTIEDDMEATKETLGVLMKQVTRAIERLADGAEDPTDPAAVDRSPYGRLERRPDDSHYQ